MYIPRRNPLQIGVMDLFRPGQQQQQSQNSGQQPIQNNNQQQNQPDPGGQGGGNRGNINDPNNKNVRQPQNGKQQGQQQQSQDDGDGNKSPLGEFKDLWEDTPPADGEQAQPDWNDHSSIVPKLKIDPQRLVASARKIDFRKAMDPAKVTAALKGDQEAFYEVMNSVQQASFANTAMTMSRMAETMMTQLAEKLYSGALPHHFRKHAVNQTIDSENPIFQDPAVAPMLEMAKQRFQVKYPKASPQEIAKMAQKYVKDFATAITGNAGDPNAGSSSGKKTGANSEETDWLDFVGEAPQQ